MSKSRMNPEVDGYLKESKKWKEEFVALRRIILEEPLTEELKWGKPCYSFEGSNIVIIQGFKENCALLFCKGALLEDPHGLLQKPGENTQAARRILFTQVREIVGKAAILKAYIQESIAAEKAGLKVSYKKISDFAIPEELQNQLDKDAALRSAFAALTPGRQRAYLLHFSTPKQAKTRESRIEKCREDILKGKGLNDR